MSATTDLVAQHTALPSLGDHVSTVDISADGGLVAAGDLDGVAVVVDLARGEVVADLARHEFGVSAVRFSPAQRLLAVGGQDGRVRLWDAERQRPVGESISGRGWVGGIAWRPDGSEVAAALGTKVIRLRPDGSESLRHTGHPTTVDCLDWTPDGRRLAVGAYGGIWWYEDATDVVKRFEWKGALLDVAVAPNGKWVASGNQDASVHCWRLWSAEDLEMTGYPAKVQHIAWDPTSRFLAVASLGDLTVWDFSGKGPRGSRPVQLAGHARHVVGLAWSPKGDVVASAAADGRVSIWRPRRGGRSLLADLQVGEELSCLVWSPDGSFLVAGGALGGLHRIDLR
jgi:WD40 repeat protein